MIRRRDSGLYEASLEDVRAEYPWNHRRHFGGAVARGLALAAGFSPLSVPGCKLYLCADSGVTVSTGVSSWLDLSGTGNHVTQGTSGAQPALVSGWRNGRNAIQCAASKWLGRAALVSAINGAMSALGVVETPASFGANEFLFGSNVGGEKYSRNANNVLKVGASNDAGTLTLPASKACVVYLDWTATGTNGTARILPHGSAVLSETNLTTGTANFTQLGVGDLYLGSVPWKGKLAALALYNRSLSVSERDRLERWAKNYYGIANT